MLNAGRASLQATTRLKEAHSAMRYNLIPSLNVFGSSVGLGTFRLQSSPDPRAVLQHALRSGINVIDTASNFGAGKCEVLLGNILSEWIGNGNSRSGLVIISKAGFIPNSHNSIPLEASIDTINRVRYSLSPSYLEYSLTESLKALKLDHLDIFMLNNPERLLSVKSLAEVQEIVQKAVEHLNLEIDRGRIGSSGISCNSLGFPEANDFWDIEGMSLGAVEYPLNLFETEARTRIADYCRSNKIYQFSQRPLMAITPKGIQKLTMAPNIEVPTSKTTENFSRVIDLEYQIAMRFDVERFTLGNILAEHMSTLCENREVAKVFIAQTVIPKMESDLLETQKDFALLPAEDKLEAEQMLTEYKSAMQTLFQSIYEMSDYHSNRILEDIDRWFWSMAYQGIEKNALGYCLASNHDGTVLLGMRSVQQVQWLMEFIKEDLPDHETATKMAELVKYSVAR
jgi:aryl-alcohol dehydrogenase-like predicted oxidoreductase